MKRLFISFAVAAAMFGAMETTTSAADMVAIKAAPPATIAPGWSGLYFGIHAGWSVANSNATSRTDDSVFGLLFAPASFDTGGSSPLFGGQLGYNWQAGNWVAGVEADISGAGLHGFKSRTAVAVFGFGSPTAYYPADNFTRQEINWLASARGRLGYASGAGMMYATAGAAWANFGYQAATTGGFAYCVGSGCLWPAAFRDTRMGWVIGGGYEWAASSRWTLRGEYLFYAFDGPGTIVAKDTAGNCPACRATYAWGDVAIHTVRLGLNYKWDGVPVAEPSARPTPSAKSWTGFYAGFHGGWTFARSDSISTTARNLAGGAFFAPAAFSLNENGPLIGGQFGYNWQTANWVLGVEADLSGAGIHGFQNWTPVCVLNGCGPSGAPTVGAGSFMRQDVNWLASVRGRIGQTWGSGLIYVTGGAAWANVDHEANTSGALVCVINPGCGFPAAFSRTRAGWTVGGGYEWPVWSNWTLRSEYLFSRFDGVGATAAPTPAPTGTCLAAGPCSVTYRWNDLDIHTLRVALNYAW